MKDHIKNLLVNLIHQMRMEGIRYEEACHEFQKEFITSVLIDSNSNQSHTAEELGLHRNTLTRKMITLRIPRCREKSRTGALYV